MQGSKDDEVDKCFYACQSGGSGKGSKSDEVGRSDTEGTKQKIARVAMVSTVVRLVRVARVLTPSLSRRYL